MGIIGCLEFDRRLGKMGGYLSKSMRYSVQVCCQLFLIKTNKHWLFKTSGMLKKAEHKFAIVNHLGYGGTCNNKVFATGILRK